MPREIQPQPCSRRRHVQQPQALVARAHVEANTYFAQHLVTTAKATNPFVDWQMALVAMLLVGAFVAAGGAAIVDATPPDIGRSPAALAALAERTGAEIVRVTTPNYDYFYLCPELRRKRMIPVLTRVRAKSIEEFGELVAALDGDERAVDLAAHGLGLVARLHARRRRHEVGDGAQPAAERLPAPRGGLGFR